MNLLYRDDMSYLDIVFGSALTREYKVELDDIRAENDLHGGYVFKEKLSKEREQHSARQRVREAEWFIGQLCEAVTKHEGLIEALSIHIKEIWMALADESNSNRVIKEFQSWLRVHYSGVKMIGTDAGYIKACGVILAELNRLREGTDDRLTGDN